MYSSTTEYQRASLTNLPTENYNLAFMGHKISYLSSLLVTCHQSSQLYGVKWIFGATLDFLVLLSDIGQCWHSWAKFCSETLSTSILCVWEHRWLCQINTFTQVQLSLFVSHCDKYQNQIRFILGIKSSQT